MKLTLLHIISFGGLNNYDIRLDDGVNVLYGPNESGKSSAAMFVKFVFYGLSSKGLLREGFDAAALCQVFGGGGHVRAAGATIFADSITEAEKKLLDAVYPMIGDLT